MAAAGGGERGRGASLCLYDEVQAEPDADLRPGGLQEAGGLPVLPERARGRGEPAGPGRPPRGAAPAPRNGWQPPGFVRAPSEPASGHEPRRLLCTEEPLGGSELLRTTRAPAAVEAVGLFRPLHQGQLSRTLFRPFGSAAACPSAASNLQPACLFCSKWLRSRSAA